MLLWMGSRPSQYSAETIPARPARLQGGKPAVSLQQQTPQTEACSIILATPKQIQSLQIHHQHSPPMCSLPFKTQAPSAPSLSPPTKLAPHQAKRLPLQHPMHALFITIIAVPSSSSMIGALAFNPRLRCMESNTSHPALNWVTHSTPCFCHIGLLAAAYRGGTGSSEVPVQARNGETRELPALACGALLPRGVNRRGRLARLDEEKQRVSAVGSGSGIPDL